MKKLFICLFLTICLSCDSKQAEPPTTKEKQKDQQEEKRTENKSTETSDPEEKAAIDAFVKETTDFPNFKTMASVRKQAKTVFKETYPKADIVAMSVIEVDKTCYIVEIIPSGAIKDKAGVPLSVIHVIVRVFQAADGNKDWELLSVEVTNISINQILQLRALAKVNTGLRKINSK